MSRWLRDWGAALVWAVAIFCVSGRSDTPVALPNDTDKLAHLVAYLVLGAALAWGGARNGVRPLLLVLLGLAYGATDEIHQLFVPGRSSDVRDWLADAVGVIAGVTLFLPLFTKLAARRRARPLSP